MISQRILWNLKVAFASCLYIMLVLFISYSSFWAMLLPTTGSSKLVKAILSITVWDLRVIYEIVQYNSM